jgi:PPM family protein phosphatase
MTLALRYAVRSDVGLLREGNEDSAYAGPHLLAVADGMGGHAAGEVASAATITTMAKLDTGQLGADLAGTLAEAVANANMRLQQIIISDPAVEGMGTTLTALLWSDGHAALVHIGDSRAYLLRNGQFYQITHDHTLVQSLVDEGRITEDDVATHPQRSLLLRALDGRTIAEPDLSTHETMAGDRYLLCSDGLSGVVTEQTLHQTLSSVWDPDKAALQLVELAIKGGGPDNITCIVADVVDTQTTALPPTRIPVMAGAASQSSPADARSEAGQNSPATRAMRLTKTNPQQALPDDQDTRGWRNRSDSRQDGGEPETSGGRHGHRGRRHGYDDDDDDDYAEHHEGKRRWPIVTTLLVILVLLIGGGLYGGWRYVQGQYYIGDQDGNVAIYRGVNQSVAGISLSSVYQRTSVQLKQVAPSIQSQISQTQPQTSLAEAQRTVAQIKHTIATCQLQYQALVNWQKANTGYQNALRAFNQKKARNPGKNPGPAPKGPGPEPAQPSTAECAPASAFGIAASALPNGTSTTAGTTPTAPPSSKATRPAVSPTPSTRRSA